MALNTTDHGGKGTGGNALALLSRVNFLVMPLLLITLVLSFVSPQFLSPMNIENVTRLAAIYVILGVGQTYVMTTGNIDLSIGSMTALVMALVGTYVLSGGPLILAVLYALVIGAVFGAINGIMVTKLRIPALLATLGALVTYRGIVNEYMYGSYHVRFPPELRFLGQGKIMGIPTPVIIAAVVALVGWYMLNHMRFGRHVVAVGANEEAARRAGINVDWVKIRVFALQGMLAGLAAIVFMGRLNSAHPNFGVGMELHIIAGTVLGGTLLFGGYGTIIGTVIGMILIGVLENGLLLAGAGFFWQQIFLGVLIVTSVAVQMHFHRKRNHQS